MFIGRVIFLLCVMTSSLYINALPRLTTGHLSPAHIRTRASENVCKNYMENCVPWETSCCKNMECMNLARGYCLYPLEKCLCQRISVDFY